MGAKSTVWLSREEAELLLIAKRAELGSDVFMSDVELEDELERLNDRIYQKDGYYQGLENYLIR